MKERHATRASVFDFEMGIGLKMSLFKNLNLGVLRVTCLLHIPAKKGVDSAILFL